MLRFVTANVDFNRDGDAAYIRHLCEHADVLLLQELKDRVLAHLLPDGWTSLQETKNEATRGSCIAIRDETVKLRNRGFHIGARPFIRSRRIGMLERWIAYAGLREIATGRDVFAISAHFPPARFRLLQPGYEKRLRGLVAKHRDVVVGTDANQPIGRLGDRLGLDGYGRGIVGLITNLSVTGEKVEPWGIGHDVTDHPSVSATVHLRKAQP